MVRRKEPSKAELQERMEAARESLSETVDEIKDTVKGQYQSVKKTVGGVVEFREHFQKDPLVWSLGALSAGFALGYTLGYAHKNAKSPIRRRSEVASFADSLVDELSQVGKTLVLPSLNSNIRELFGFDFSDVLEEIGRARRPSRKKRRLESAARKRARTKKDGANRVED